MNPKKYLYLSFSIVLISISQSYVSAQKVNFGHSGAIQYVDLPELKTQDNPFQSKPNLMIENKADYYALFDEKNHKKLPEIDFEKLMMQDTKIHWKDPLIIDHDSVYQALKKKYPEISSTLNEVDFSQYTVLADLVGGDCHARFRYEVLDDPKAQKYIFNIYNIWGGCRAGGLWEHWIKVPKAPKGYRYEFKVVLVD